MPFSPEKCEKRGYSAGPCRNDGTDVRGTCALIGGVVHAVRVIRHVPDGPRAAAE